MEELMKEAHALFCGGWGVKESQVFMSTLQHLLTAATQTDDPDAAKTRCWATPQRWLLTLDTTSLRAALWNPSTKKKVDLPSMDKDLPQNCKCLLSREPDSRAGCVVLVVDDDEPVIWFCRVGGAQWSRHEYDITVEKPRGSHAVVLLKDEDELARFSRDGETVPSVFVLEKHNWTGVRVSSSSGNPGGSRSERLQIRSIAAVDGRFYFDVSASKLGVLDFLPGPVFTTLDTERLRVERSCWELAFSHLVESRGRLYLLAMTGSALSSMELYEMDFSKLAWSPVDRVYDQVFFLGRLRFTASCSAWELGLTRARLACSAKMLPSVLRGKAVAPPRPANTAMLICLLVGAGGFAPCSSHGGARERTAHQPCGHDVPRPARRS
ncbi:hypothetical protein CFC21_003021 [Triticum aestivum]|uniref:KIB1-4 beta-propeller domain-containing protein n=1 Tax=Triticum aestivum TaxID=4565 RepID=A0A3B5Y396_WHEAT|nr:uncharacterized protein LOC123059718 [Triticum aestivum]XP_044338150.1 uncharacterized protein LOC123059718 [Triticum aestivum]KAF6985125.1 hypothetical protein CFC21_003021 [Triticum aestivum]